MSIRVVAIGKKHESWVNEGIMRYQKRLGRLFRVDWVLLPHSVREGQEGREDESERILSGLTDRDYVILLDERGTPLNSPSLASLLARQLASTKRLVIIIGGAYGVDERVRRRADFMWSLSPLVFPHQLVRLILVEQLYRAQEITGGHPYHHE